MKLTKIEGEAGAILQGPEAEALLAEALAAYAGGNIDALYDLGVAFSTGSHGANCDMIEAHKWFNIAASKGHEEAAWCRADISDEMTAREIAEAQRRARQWLAEGRRRVA
jgi:TPR repeat protein